jgi:hypothetical protein
MPTTTHARGSSAATAGRFTRSAGTRSGTRSGRRKPVAQRHGFAGGWLQRRQPAKQSGLKRALGGVAGALPGAGKKPSTSSSKTARRGTVGGLALLAGAAGLVFKNRDKVASLARRDDGERHPDAFSAQTPVTPPSAEPAMPGTPPTNTGANEPPRF